jgi:copper(I)-binding protein
MARFLLVVGAGAVAVGIAAACGSSRDAKAPPPDRTLNVVDAYAAEPVADGPAVVYFTVRNGTGTADTLVAATTPIAATATLHRQTSAGMMMHMEPAGPLAVPAGGELRLEPGGLHLMLEQLARRPLAGDTIDVTLEFRHAGSIPVRVPVIAYAAVTNRAGRAPH